MDMVAAGELSLAQEHRTLFGIEDLVPEARVGGALSLRALHAPHVGTRHARPTPFLSLSPHVMPLPSHTDGRGVSCL